MYTNVVNPRREHALKGKGKGHPRAGHEGSEGGVEL